MDNQIFQINPTGSCRYYIFYWDYKKKNLNDLPDDKNTNLPPALRTNGNIIWVSRAAPANKTDNRKK